MKSILLLLGAEDSEDLDAAIDEIYEIERILAEVHNSVSIVIACMHILLIICIYNLFRNFILPLNYEMLA